MPASATQRQLDATRAINPPSDRKPMARAASSVQRSETVFRGKVGRPKLHAELAYPVENATLICNILRSPEKRERIYSYLKRLRNNKKKRYDPRNAPRIISQGLHWPQIAVELVIQGKPEEMDEWFREFHLGVSRADAAVQRYWERRIA